MDPTVRAAAVSAGIVAILCAIIAVACWRAVLRTGNPRIQAVVAAFVLLSAKNLFKSIWIASGEREEAWLELAFSLADLAAVGLIAWPLLRPRGD